MNHLTDEQFEDIMQGKDADLRHLSECKDCQNALAEKRAVAKRLQMAFKSVKPDASLEETIRGRINEKRRQLGLVVSGGRPWKTRLNDKMWSTLAAAAVLFAVAIPLAIYLSASSSAIAGQAELVRIHEHNMSPHTEFFSDSDPEKLAAYLKDTLGFTPAMPAEGHGLAIRGCCIAHFKEQITGSYVVSTPSGIISIIVVPDTPKDIAMDRMPAKKGYGQTFWKSSYAHCNMVAVRLGDYTYCGVGEISKISHEYLRDLLNRLLSDTQPS
ncbi:MAG: hypothetical protein FVQ82_00620 [Planctomycetes bacterium]|nr:hypothetical protein [Planctomycetota bacterium]